MVWLLYRKWFVVSTRDGTTWDGIWCGDDSVTPNGRCGSGLVFRDRDRGCAGQSAPKSDAGGSSPLTYVDAGAIDIAGTWEGEASILTVDSGAMRSFGRYEITAPIDGVFTVRETLNLEKPSELEQGAPLATTRQQDLIGVISPDGSIRMVKITD